MDASNVIFYNAALDASQSAVSRHIHYLLNGLEPLPGMADARLVELYDEWRAVCLGLEADLRQKGEKPMIQMPPDDAEHKACRRMAAVIIERTVWSEFAAERYLRPAINQIKVANRAFSHPASCACHQLEGWTGRNEKMVGELRAWYAAYAHHDMCSCGTCHAARVEKGTDEAYLKACQDATNAVLDRIDHGNTQWIGNLIREAGKADNAIAAAHAMPGETDSGFVKNLFQTVQGVAYDSTCPHKMPFYACMSCSH